jgi:hypothetical protein
LEYKTSIIEVSERIVANIALKDKNYTIEPILVIAIASLIVNIIRLIYKCNNNKKFISQQIKTTSWIYKLLLRKEINKIWKNKSDRELIYSGIIEISSELSETELYNILEVALEE